MKSINYQYTVPPQYWEPSDTATPAAPLLWVGGAVIGYVVIAVVILSWLNKE